MKVTVSPNSDGFFDDVMLVDVCAGSTVCCTGMMPRKSSPVESWTSGLSLVNAAVMGMVPTFEIRSIDPRLPAAIECLRGAVVAPVHLELHGSGRLSRRCCDRRGERHVLAMHRGIGRARYRRRRGGRVDGQSGRAARTREVLGIAWIEGRDDVVATAEAPRDRRGAVIRRDACVAEERAVEVGRQQGRSDRHGAVEEQDNAERREQCSVHGHGHGHGLSGGGRVGREADRRACRPSGCRRPGCVPARDDQREHGPDYQP